jgi:DNA-binding NarL/FixJ family response regulator
MKIKVLLVDDHKIMREGLKALLVNETDIEVVAEAADGNEAVARAAESSPDVVVMDISMPEMNGIEATKQIVAAAPQVGILALSMMLNRAYVVEALKAGARGYLVKDCAAEELVTAIRSVHQGNSFLSTEITKLVIRDYMKGASEDAGSGYTTLSRREREVLQAIADGKSTKEIAFDFGVSIKTIETQRMNTMKKLNLYSIAELTKYAIREGLSSLG